MLSAVDAVLSSAAGTTLNTTVTVSTDAPPPADTSENSNMTSVAMSPLDDTGNIQDAATAALPVSAGVTEMSAHVTEMSAHVTEISVGVIETSERVTETSLSADTSPVSLLAPVADALGRGDAAAGSTGVSPHTGSSISSPSELSTDVHDEQTASAMTTIPLVRTPSAADSTLHIKPQRLSQAAAADTAVTDTKHADSVTAAAADVSQNGDSGHTATESATTTATSTTTSTVLSANNETTSETVSDEVR